MESYSVDLNFNYLLIRLLVISYKITVKVFDIILLLNIFINIFKFSYVVKVVDGATKNCE